jgi:ATP-dependent Clp protease, protease subunit
MGTSQAPPLADYYITFCSTIDQASVQRLMLMIDVATQKKAKAIHLLFQSTGGTVGDGVCLYNFLKNLPIHLSIYNMGSVQSIATIAYLGAKRRVTSANAIFAIHRTSVSPQYAMAFALKHYVETVAMDDRRTEEILRTHITMGDDKWSRLDRSDLWFSAQDAMDFGIANEIGEFAPPMGAEMYNA